MRERSIFNFVSLPGLILAVLMVGHLPAKSKKSQSLPGDLQVGDRWVNEAVWSALWWGKYKGLRTEEEHTNRALEATGESRKVSWTEKLMGAREVEERGCHWRSKTCKSLRLSVWNTPGVFGPELIVMGLVARDYPREKKGNPDWKGRKTVFADRMILLPAELHSQRKISKP